MEIKVHLLLERMTRKHTLNGRIKLNKFLIIIITLILKKCKFLPLSSRSML